MAEYVKLTKDSPIVNAPSCPHVHLACENHPNLRWSCKNIAISPDRNGDMRWNRLRHLFFVGNLSNEDDFTECSCPTSKLVGVERDQAE